MIKPHEMIDNYDYLVGDGSGYDLVKAIRNPTDNEIKEHCNLSDEDDVKLYSAKVVWFYDGEFESIVFYRIDSGYSLYIERYYIMAAHQRLPS